MSHTRWHRLSWIAALSAISCTTETYSTLKNHKETEASEGGTAGKPTSGVSGGTVATSASSSVQGGASEVPSEASAGNPNIGSGGSVGTTVSTPTGGAGSTAIGGSVGVGSDHTGGLFGSGGTGTGGSAANTGTNTAAGSTAAGGQSATGGTSTTGGNSASGAAGRSATGGNGSAGQAAAGPFPQPTWCPASQSWQGCDSTGAVCRELIASYPYYSTYRGNNCKITSADCTGSYSACPSACGAPALSDKSFVTDPATCSGAVSGGWVGCRFSGCTPCVEELTNYPNYFNNHLNCKPNCTCNSPTTGYQLALCSANCPAPTDADK